MPRYLKTSAALLATALAVTGCGGAGPDQNEASGVSEVALPSPGEGCTADRAGGTITMGEYTMLPSFAPGQGAYGVVGGSQSAAVYDRLMRWDAQGEEFVPQLAESLESDDTSTRWTLTLPEGVEFSNGDPLTASDVAFTVGLHQDPATRSMGMADARQAADVEVVDDQTVEFVLSEPWAGFPSMLTGPVGEVIPQQAFEAASPEEWAAAPIGAGAYLLDEYIPGQTAVMKPNPNYYGGEVCPTLEFVRVPGSQGTFEAFQTGELQVGFLRGAKIVHDAMDAGMPGFYAVLSSGSIINLNNGAGGYDGVFTDVRARRAVAHALDRELMDQRLSGGLGQPTAALLSEDSRFYSGQEGPTFDPERASALVEEVKQDTGWDGGVTLVIGDGPENVESGVVIKALLDAVGFDVTIESTAVSQVTARQFTGDYEMMIGGSVVTEADPAHSLWSAVVPGGATNFTGTDDERLVKAVAELKATIDAEELTDRLAEFQALHDEVVPYTVHANAEEYVVVAESVHGLAPTLHNVILFDDAYIQE